ncbi:hypothetical protein P8918_13005 [Bacillus spizizenii]|nr:hypothetical protein [Bacillus spizizenii]MCY8890489.1 hypothetical protein [Bacillus spizizenii]MEC0841944.1 hypothetical protein [Bacillus spizizenii]
MDVLNKKDAIKNLVNFLENDDIEILQMNANNEGHDFVGGRVNTGFKTIELRLLNKKQHKEFVKKMQK